MVQLYFNNIHTSSSKNLNKHIMDNMDMDRVFIY